MDADTYRWMNNSANWAEHNPANCLCGGRGWVLSDWDTWHECRLHGGTPHPESEEDFDFNAHHLKVHRAAYLYFRQIARKYGFVGDFKKACAFNIKLRGIEPSPATWVAEAEEVCSQLCHEFADAEAQKMGFSCALERRWHADAEDERAGWA